MEIETTYMCAYCFQMNAITVDSTGGQRQEYIEDCQVCCKPNNLTIALSEDLLSAEVYAEVA